MLVLLLREEELKWYERAKVKTFLEGDDNTRFFYLVANGKHRKQHIYKLENDQGVVIGDAQLKSYITQFIKTYLGLRMLQTLHLRKIEFRIFHK